MRTELERWVSSKLEQEATQLGLSAGQEAAAFAKSETPHRVRRLLHEARPGSLLVRSLKFSASDPCNRCLFRVVYVAVLFDAQHEEAEAEDEHIVLHQAISRFVVSLVQA